MARTTKTSGTKKKAANRAVTSRASKTVETSPEPAPTVVTKVNEKPRTRRRLAIGSRLNPSRLLAELVGSFILTFVVVAALSGKLTLSFFATPEILQQAAASGQSIPSFGIMPYIGGLALAVLLLAVYRISNGFFNPAVVLGQMVLRRTGVVEGLGYIVAQLLGAMLALTVATRLITVFNPATAGTAALDPATLFSRLSDWNVFFAELLGAFVFGFGIAAAMRYRALPRAILAGASFTIGIGIAAVAGAGLLSPALAIGVGLFGFGGGDMWMLAGIYIGAPIIGIVIGMALHALLARSETVETTVLETRKV